MRLAMVMTLVFGLAGVASAQSGGPKIGWVDLQRTLQETKAGKAAREKLEGEKNEKQKQVNDLKEKLKKQAEDLEKQKVVLKPDAVQKRERELQEEFAKLQQTFVQLQQDLARAEGTLTREIQASLQHRREHRQARRLQHDRRAQRGGHDYADPALDITRGEQAHRRRRGQGRRQAPAKDHPQTRRRRRPPRRQVRARVGITEPISRRSIRLAASLGRHVPTGMLPPRSLPSGRLDAERSLIPYGP